MSLRSKLRSLFFSLTLGPAVDHPSNGGITGEDYPEDEREDDDNPEKEST